MQQTCSFLGCCLPGSDCTLCMGSVCDSPSNLLLTCTYTALISTISSPVALPSTLVWLALRLQCSRASVTAATMSWQAARYHATVQRSVRALSKARLTLAVLIASGVQPVMSEVLLVLVLP